MHYELIIEWLKGIESVNGGKGFNVDCLPSTVHKTLIQLGLIKAAVIGKTIALTEYGRAIQAAAVELNRPEVRQVLREIAESHTND